MKRKLFKVGGILITSLVLAMIPVSTTSSLVVSDKPITASETETTSSEKQETINADICKADKEVIHKEKKIVTKMYTTASLNVRKKPNKNSKLITTLPKGTKVKRVENGKKWDKIEVEGKEYYVKDKYLSKTKPETKKSDKKVSSKDEAKNQRYPITVKLTKKEKRDLAALVKLEGGGEPIECQKAIASVVINRMMYWDASLDSIIYAKNQFTPAHRVPYTTPSKTQIKIVEDICKNGTTIPKKVLYFRAGYFFNWSTVVNYKKIGNTCFSSLK